MNKEVKFSIVIPTYNRANFIVDTVKSCLVQSYTDFEVLIVDDGGTDNTEEVIQTNFMDSKKVKYFYKENEERGAARNFGSLNSNGDYILFLDSDDFMEIDCLKNYHKAILVNNEPKVLFAKYRFIQEGRYFNSDVEYFKEGWYDWNIFLKGNPFASMICFKNDKDGISIPESREITTSEDWVFNLMKTFKSKFYYVGDLGYSMQQHDSRSMNSNQDFVIQTKINATKFIQENLDLGEKENTVLEGHSNFFCAIHSYVARDRKLGFHFLTKTNSSVSIKRKLMLAMKLLIGRGILLKLKRNSI